MMYHVTICTTNKTLECDASEGQSLSELLREHVPSFALPCAGNHTCGKCRVFVQGDCGELKEAERVLLPADAVEKQMRLACFCSVHGDLMVTMPEEGASRIVSWYQTPPFARTEQGYGFAVDIGTTTVAMQLLCRDTGRVLAERLEENAQRSFGADVISRIEACKTDGLDTLSNRIAEQLERLAQDCMREAGVADVVESVVTGNSTMLHLYEELDPSSLAVVPFDVQSYFGGLSRRTLAGAPVYLPRCIGAYVGADIVCAVLASNLFAGGTQLLTDIGTNGEVALAHDGKLICCSTAAGPAFEGAGLSCGMPAAPGAIREVDEDGGTISYKTVQNAPAVGICGSGVLDALAVMLRTEAMDDTGCLEEDEDYRIGDSSVVVSQRDVRQVQLAKSAICAGIMTLLGEEGLTGEQVERLLIAGGFGSSIKRQSACAIGLFPAALEKKCAFIGNGALGGATMLLQSKTLRQKAEALAAEATEISLSASPVFMEQYIDCMSFMEF